jgi:ketopantoate reductase
MTSKVGTDRLPTVRNTIPNVTTEDLPPFDFVVVTTKNVADVPPFVTDVIAPAVTPGHTAITLLQNGLNIERPVIAAFPTNPVLSGITVIGAREHPRGTITHTNYVSPVHSCSLLFLFLFPFLSQRKEH